MVFALLGNQNSGKTTLFNQLTGSRQRVGNFPGVTVEQKTGTITGHKNIELVDLPGIYSLSPYSGEEIITRDFLLNIKPDLIINIVDATNIERNLYLTLQLIELQIPMVMALNMIDEVQENGGSIDILKLRKTLGIPVIPTRAIKKYGLPELLDNAILTANNKTKPQYIDFCPGGVLPDGGTPQFSPVHRTIHAISHLIEDHAGKQNIPLRFAASKLVEGDEPLLTKLRLSSNEAETIEHAILEMETEQNTDREAAMADMRYQFIEDLCNNCVVKVRESREYRRSVILDSILTHKIWAYPAFLGIIFAIFWLTFGIIGMPLSELLEEGIGLISEITHNALEGLGINPVLQSLIIDGIFAGVGAVLGFIPIIITLFFFLSILEDSGYMARIAYIMDKPLRKIGLSGRSFVPMLMGFGCTVPAIMATRTLSSERDRKITIFLSPFMSCSAKVPIYALFTAAFFPGNHVLIIIILYLFGILTGIFSGLVMKETLYRGAPVPFVMELPNYRFPSARTVLILLWEKAKDFIQRAFTIIFIASIIIWFLQSFDIRLNHVEESSQSILAAIGQFISVVLRPLGFSDWRISTALITGFMAKEAVISTLAVLTGSAAMELGNVLHNLFSPLSAFSFLVFTLLYTPCVASIATVRRELGSLKGTIMIIIYQTLIAWFFAFIIYQLGTLIL